MKKCGVNIAEVGEGENGTAGDDWLLTRTRLTGGTPEVCGEQPYVSELFHHVRRI